MPPSPATEEPSSSSSGKRKKNAEEEAPEAGSKKSKAEDSSSKKKGGKEEKKKEEEAELKRKEEEEQLRKNELYRICMSSGYALVPHAGDNTKSAEQLKQARTYNCFLHGAMNACRAQADRMLAEIQSPMDGTGLVRAVFDECAAGVNPQIAAILETLYEDAVRWMWNTSRFQGSFEQLRDQLRNGGVEPVKPLVLELNLQDQSFEDTAPAREYLMPMGGAGLRVVCAQTGALIVEIGFHPKDDAASMMMEVDSRYGTMFDYLRLAADTIRCHPLLLNHAGADAVEVAVDHGIREAAERAASRIATLYDGEVDATKEAIVRLEAEAKVLLNSEELDKLLRDKDAAKENFEWQRRMLQVYQDHMQELEQRKKDQPGDVQRMLGAQEEMIRACEERTALLKDVYEDKVDAHENELMNMREKSREASACEDKMVLLRTLPCQKKDEMAADAFGNLVSKNVEQIVKFAKEHFKAAFQKYLPLAGKKNPLHRDTLQALKHIMSHESVKLEAMIAHTKKMNHYFGMAAEARAEATAKAGAK